MICFARYRNAFPLTLPKSEPQAFRCTRWIIYFKTVARHFNPPLPATQNAAITLTFADESSLNQLNLSAYFTMKSTYRKNIHPGLLVRIVMKEDQRSGDLTEGIVTQVLTNSPQHPHGIKVRLDTGEVGRVKEIIEEEEIDWPE